MNPLTYSPQKPADFIGDARTVAEFFIKLIASSQAEGNSAIKVLLNGPPGIGKSELIKFLMVQAGIHPKWSTHKFNGTKVNMDAIDQMEAAMHYRDLYGSYKLFWVDEVDAMIRNPAAQMRFLTLLDDLPVGNIVACTSNCKVSEFEPRFQSRFLVQELRAVPAHDIENLLLKFLPNPTVAKQIATFACGNVRQALLDCKGALLAMG